MIISSVHFVFLDCYSQLDNTSEIDLIMTILINQHITHHKGNKNERIWTITPFHRWAQINLKLSYILQHNLLQTIPVYPFLLNRHIISINSYYYLSRIHKSSLINTSLSIPFITILISKLNIILNNHSTFSDFWWQWF